METMTTECKPKIDSLDFTLLSQPSKISSLDESLIQFPSADLTEGEQSEGLRTYSCTYPNCTKTFRYRSEISRHMVTHSDQRPCKCPYKECNKGFKRLDALATHVRLHTGDKPFKCPVGSCQLTFATKAGLRYHTLKHKNNKLFRCDYPGCEQSFLTNSQLKQHQRGAKVHEGLQAQNSQEPTQICIESKIGQNPSADCENLSWLSTNEYEPPVQKRVQIDKPSMPQLTPVASKQNEQISIFGANLKTEKIDSGLSQLLPAASQMRTNGNLGSVPQAELTGLMNLSAKKVGKELREELELGSTSQIDQTKLLKSINKVLDENMALKQHLEVCQKIISIYQANLGELKDRSIE